MLHSDIITLLLATLAILLFSVVALLFFLIARQRQQEARLHERLDRLSEEVRYDIPPARRATIEASIIAILRKNVEAGVAFFVSPTLALTAAHNLAAGRVKFVVCVRPTDKVRLVFDVAALDAELDVAVLRLRAHERPSRHFLTIPPAIDPAAPGEKGVFLVTCNIRMATELPDVAAVSVAWHHARIVGLHPRHLLYDSTAFDGDSGGAIVVARTGNVIGLHSELVNAARELIARKDDFGERLNDVEQSVMSLIRGTTSGCVGVRLDCGVTRCLLEQAAAAPAAPAPAVPQARRSIKGRAR
jgi:hypothetical protein